jgi:hypothetical protein
MFSNKRRTHDLIRNNTISLVASIVAEPTFPEEKHVPLKGPLPFTNFGHQPLVDQVTLFFISKAF